MIDKPQGLTSHQVVGKARRALGTRKVGHAGTLDPMATGVLLLGVNRATRLLGHLMLTEKTYTATIRLGVSTVTDDAEGEVVETPGASGIDEDRIRQAIVAFTGDIEQVPSSVSAIKIDGKRSYARVRAGEQVELAARPVHIEKFSLLEVEPGSFGEVAVIDCRVRVVCSSGTYIRSLARDLGRALGTAGHLTALRRTRVGAFDVGEASDLDDPVLVPMATAAGSCFPLLEADAEQARDVGYGRSLDLGISKPVAVVREGELLGIYEPHGDRARPVAVFSPAQ